jgi:hypothetical protein
VGRPPWPSTNSTLPGMPAGTNPTDSVTYTLLHAQCTSGLLDFVTLSQGVHDEAALDVDALGTHPGQGRMLTAGAWLALTKCFCSCNMCISLQAAAAAAARCWAALLTILLLQVGYCRGTHLDLCTAPIAAHPAPAQPQQQHGTTSFVRSLHWLHNC